MKWFLVFILFFTIACSSNERSRQISSDLSEAGSCYGMIHPFFDAKWQRLSDELTVENLVADGKVERSVFDEISSSEFFKKELFEKQLGPEADKQNELSALSLSILKQQHPDYSEQKLLTKYRILLKFCDL